MIAVVSRLGLILTIFGAIRLLFRLWDLLFRPAVLCVDFSVDLDVGQLLVGVNLEAASNEILQI